MFIASARISPPRRRVLCAAVLGLLFLSPATVQARDTEQGPFFGMAGSWTGGGTVTMADGTKERIRCRATYSVPSVGATLSQGLRCASDSYQFDVKSNVQASADGALSGTWSEAVHGVTGDVTGRVLGAGKIETSVATLGFSAALSVSTQGRRQHVLIRPQGNDVQSVTIEMQRI